MNKYIFITVKLYPKKAKIEKYKDDYEDSDSDEPVKDESDASSSVNGNLFSSDDENTENEDDYDNEYQNNVGLAAAAYNPNAAPWRPAFN